MTMRWMLPCTEWSHSSLTISNGLTFAINYFAVLKVGKNVFDPHTKEGWKNLCNDKKNPNETRFPRKLDQSSSLQQCKKFPVKSILCMSESAENSVERLQKIREKRENNTWKYLVFESSSEYSRIVHMSWARAQVWEAIKIFELNHPPKIPTHPEKPQSGFIAAYVLSSFFAAAVEEINSSPLQHVGMLFDFCVSIVR